MLGFFGLFQGMVYACDVPVFRYAMERWVADYYEGVLIHKGALAQDADIDALLQGEAAELLNLRLSKMDLASVSEEDVNALLGEKVPEKLPALALWYPMLKGRGAPFWTGEFTPATVTAITDSPKRKELAKRLSEGQSGVWILVESGDAAKDKAALQLLNKEMETATKELTEMLPTIVDQAETPGLSFKFSVLPVSRSDPNEQFLLTSLLRSEPDLENYANEPVLFPVFGRGRVLYALVGEGINADNIREAIGFLTGPCGCEIKMLNPGFDLPVSFNWDAAVMQFYEEFYETQQTPMELTSVFPTEPEQAGVMATQQAGTENSPEPAAAQAGGPQTRATPRLGVMGIAALSLGGIVLIVALGTLAVGRRRKEQP
jgi:hypothetical protein